VTESDIATAPFDPALRTQIVSRIGDLLPRVLKREVTDVSEDANLMHDLGMSSTTALELVLELEEALEREISVEDMGREDFDTVGTLATYIAGNLLPEE
jgi:acyl carrier protein